MLDCARQLDEIMAQLGGKGEPLPFENRDRSKSYTFFDNIEIMMKFFGKDGRNYSSTSLMTSEKIHSIQSVALRSSFRALRGREKEEKDSDEESQQIPPNQAIYGADEIIHPSSSFGFVSMNDKSLAEQLQDATNENIKDDLPMISSISTTMKLPPLPCSPPLSPSMSTNMLKTSENPVCFEPSTIHAFSEDDDLWYDESYDEDVTDDDEVEEDNLSTHQDKLITLETFSGQNISIPQLTVCAPNTPNTSNTSNISTPISTHISSTPTPLYTGQVPSSSSASSTSSSKSSSTTQSVSTSQSPSSLHVAENSSLFTKTPSLSSRVTDYQKNNMRDVSDVGQEDGIISIKDFETEEIHSEKFEEVKKNESISGEKIFIFKYIFHLTHNILEGQLAEANFITLSGEVK
jgi:hypothetical protein